MKWNWETAAEAGTAVLSAVACVAAGAGMVGEAKNLGKMMKEDNVVGRLKESVERFGSGSKPSLCSGGGKGTKSNKLALGLSDYLDDFASKNNAHTWKDFADPSNWKAGVNDALFDPDMEIVVNLDGVDNPLLAAQRAASNRGGATDWELLQIKLTPSAWDRITWYKGGEIIPNPFE